jgi:polygalacturonase
LPRNRHLAFSRPSVIFIIMLVGAAAATGIGLGIATATQSGNSFTCSAKGTSVSRHVAVAGLRMNGSGNDYSAIQNAIDMAGRVGGGIVTLPAGTFTINGHLTLRNNVELTGIGPATVIKAGPYFLDTKAPAGGYPLITTGGAVNTTIANLTADQSGGTLNGNIPGRLLSYVVEGRGSNDVVVNNVYVRNPFTYSIAMVGTRNFCVENSNVQVTDSDRYSQLDGIHILDSSYGDIINNVIQSGDDGLVAHTIGSSVHDVLYALNKVRGGASTDGMKLAVGDFPIYNIKIEDNNFYGSRFGIRTAYYDQRTGAVSNIVISANDIHGLVQGDQAPAIAIGGTGGLGPVTNVTVEDTQACDAGIIAVQRGSGNAVTGTVRCTGEAR